VSLNAVTSLPARRSVPQSSRSWGDSRQLVWNSVKELRQQNVKADEQRIGQLLAELMEHDDDLRVASAYLLAHDALVAERVARQRPTSTPRQRAERQATEKATVKRLAQKARERIWLDLPIVLLSGESKQLRYVTGRELVALGVAYAKIAERVGPDEMLGERLTEAEVKALLAAGA
jgi:hypothetical protein